MENPVWPILGVVLIVGLAYLLSEIEERNSKNKK
jgi:hypothetical protein